MSLVPGQGHFGPDAIPGVIPRPFKPHTPPLPFIHTTTQPLFSGRALASRRVRLAQDGPGHDGAARAGAARADGLRQGRLSARTRGRAGAPSPVLPNKSALFHSPFVCVCVRVSACLRVCVSACACARARARVWCGVVVRSPYSNASWQTMHGATKLCFFWQNKPASQFCSPRARAAYIFSHAAPRHAEGVEVTEGT